MSRIGSGTIHRGRLEWSSEGVAAAPFMSARPAAKSGTDEAAGRTADSAAAGAASAVEAAFSPAAAGAPANPFLPAVLIGVIRGYPTAADFNNDGLYEPFGFLNNGDGTFSDAPFQLSILPILQNYPGRQHRDNRAVDIDGDGNLDVVWNVYHDPAAANSFTLILYGDGTGHFDHYEERRDIDGYGETIVTADFDNDGDSDVYVPVYTHIYGSDSNYLLLNENGVLGANVAEEWGVALSNLPVSFRVEGAQAADVNFDGRIDMFVGSHLFINEGQSFSSIPLNPFRFEEGANLIDYDNDGDFDLVLRSAYFPDFTPRLFEWNGSAFIDQGSLTAPDITTGFGLNVYDLDANGWEDLVFPSNGGLTALFNHDGVFSRVDIPVATTLGPLAFFDHDQDGRADLLSFTPPGSYYLLENNLAVGDSLSLNVLGAGGELNQHGRSLVLNPRQAPDIHMARVVDGGSGYLTQNQYELMIGLPVAGAYDVAITFADRILEFVAGAGQRITAFADGRVHIVADGDADTLGGGDGDDILDGGGGNDTIFGSLGADDVDGGGGVDTLDFSALGQAVQVDLSQDTAIVAGETQDLTDIENVVGTAFADELFGDSGANVLTGGGGNDIYVAGAGDTIVELAGQGIDEVRTALASYTLAANVENLTGTAATGQHLFGNALNNVIAGGLAADDMRGGQGNDIYMVGAGDLVVELAGEGIDEVRTALASYTLTAHVENLTGTGAGGQLLIGNSLGNAMAGGAGADEMRGGQGNDVYTVGAGDLVVELAGEGVDEVRTALASYTLAAHVENLTGTGSGAKLLIGNTLDNIIIGGSGADDMRGGQGDDTYYVAQSGDIVREAAGEGFDWVHIEASHALAAGQEVEVLSTRFHFATTAINLIGNAFDQIMIGNAGANVLSGGGGADDMRGLAGNDIYYVDSASDIVSELAGEGTDRINVEISYTLAPGLDIEVLSTRFNAGVQTIDLIGNELAQILIGNAGTNVLYGGGGADDMRGLAGNDTYYVNQAGDIVRETVGNGFDSVYVEATYTLTAGQEVELLSTSAHFGTGSINLTGNEFANILIGNAGANTLSGGRGADEMRGLAGNDLYVVEHVGDIVVEVAGGGIDEVRTTLASYTLAANVENLTGIAAATGQKLVGNDLANVIRAGAGFPFAFGGSTMIGLGGNDIYYVGDEYDYVFEFANQGFDTIYTPGSYRLLAGYHIEAITALNPTATTALDLYGNEFNQILTGNAGANRLESGEGSDTLRGLGGNDALIGGLGVDVMEGGTGDDTYVVDHSSDVVTELAGQGNDIVLTSASYALTANSSIELLSTSGHFATDAIDLTGSSIGQVIIGNAGSNLLDGKGGSDDLRGVGGADSFAFTTALGAANVDIIRGFSGADDLILLENAVFNGLAAGALDPNAFVAGPAAIDADDRIVYNNLTGALFFDADGNGAGAAVQFATLEGAPALAASDFMVI